MSNETCILTSKDFTILEVMRDRCADQETPFARLLDRKINSAIVMFQDELPANVATLNSRVAFSIDSRTFETRVISHDQPILPVGMFLPITTLRGLALLGLAEGQAFVAEKVDDARERITLHNVLYQPEAARRQKEAVVLTA